MQPPNGTPQGAKIEWITDRIGRATQTDPTNVLRKRIGLAINIGGGKAAIIMPDQNTAPLVDGVLFAAMSYAELAGRVAYIEAALGHRQTAPIHRLPNEPRVEAEEPL